MGKISVEFNEAELKALVCQILADRLYKSLISSVQDKGKIIRQAQHDAEKKLKDEIYEQMRRELGTV